MFFAIFDLFNLYVEFSGALFGLPDPSRIDPDRCSSIFVDSRPASSTFSYFKKKQGPKSYFLVFLFTNELC